MSDEEQPSVAAGASPAEESPAADAAPAAEGGRLYTEAELPPEEVETLEQPLVAVADDADVNRELRRLSRRGFLTFGIASAAGYAGWRWLGSREGEDGVPWPLRRTLQMNERVAEGYFSKSRLSPTFRPSDITRRRVNGDLGLDPAFDPATWRLHIEGAAAPVVLTLADIKALPKHTQITELRCIEGWSTIVQWSGARLADLVAKFPPPGRSPFMALETPDHGYYVGLDMDSALHPQTLLAYEMNGQPLRPEHGAPLRLAIPVKYGIKNLKRIGTIRYASVRPADFWGERGYDWYAGH